MSTATTLSPIVPDGTVERILTALAFEPGLTRDLLVNECKTYLRQHYNGFDESRTPCKKLLLATFRHGHTNYDQLLAAIRQTMAQRDRKRLRWVLRRHIATAYTRLLAPSEQQGATR